MSKRKSLEKEEAAAETILINTQFAFEDWRCGELSAIEAVARIRTLLDE